MEERQSNANRLKVIHDLTVRTKNCKHQKENLHADFIETIREKERQLHALKEQIDDQKQEKNRRKSQNQRSHKTTTTISRKTLSFSCPLKDAGENDTL